MSLLPELEADLQELQKLLDSAQRKRTQELLKADIEKLRLQIESEKANHPQPVVPATDKNEEKKEAPVRTGGQFTSITNYSFDQEGKILKIYISLNEIGTLDPSNIDFGVTKDSLDVKIYDFKNANWRFAIKQLNAAVEPEKCKFIQKNNTLIIRLQKAKEGNWAQVPYKEALFKASGEKIVKEDADPSASLMDMMKKLYQEGDADMKKSIAEAWQKAQNEKAAKGGSA